MVEFERHLCKSSCLLCLNLVTQVHVHTAFEHLQRWRLQDLSRQLVGVLDHPPSHKVFPDAQGVPLFHSVPSVSAPATGCFREEPGPVIFAASLQVLICIDEMPLSLLFSLDSPSSPSHSSQETFQSLHHFWEPLLGSLQHLHVLGSPDLNTALLVWPPQCREEGRRCSLPPGFQGLGILPWQPPLPSSGPQNALLDGAVPSQVQGSAVPLAELSLPTLDS